MEILFGLIISTLFFGCLNYVLVFIFLGLAFGGRTFFWEVLLPLGVVLIFTVGIIVLAIRSSMKFRSQGYKCQGEETVREILNDYQYGK
jgi:hypothetical protein